MALTPLLDFFKSAFLFAQVDEAEIADDPDASQNLASHRRLVWISGGGGVVGLLTGIFRGILRMEREDPRKAAQEGFLLDVLMPAMAAIVGILCGFSLSCLFASRRYFQSPLGQRLMKVLGTKSRIVARLVSLIVAVLTGGVLVGLWFLPVAPR